MPPPAHAFVDESRRGDTYLLAAVLVAVADVQSVTRAMRDSLPPGRRRAHFRSEGARIRRRVLDAYCRLPTRLVVVTAEYRGGNDQVARGACLSAMVEALGPLGVRVLVLDTRDLERDRWDRQVIAQLVRKGQAPPDLVYEHRGSRDELLLGLPDAFAWAYGAGGKWRRQVEPLVALSLRA